MTSIEEMHKACIILDLIKASKMQIAFVHKEDFEERYGFILPAKTKGDFHWISIDNFANGSKIDVINTIQINGYSFVFIDPRQGEDVAKLFNESGKLLWTSPTEKLF